MLPFSFGGRSGFFIAGQCVKTAETGGRYLKCWCYKASKSCHSQWLPPLRHRCSRFPPVSMSPPITLCFSDVTLKSSRNQRSFFSQAAVCLTSTCVVSGSWLLSIQTPVIYILSDFVLQHLNSQIRESCD